MKRYHLILLVLALAMAVSMVSACSEDSECAATEWCNEASVCTALTCIVDPNSCPQGQTCQANDAGNTCVAADPCSACGADEWCNEASACVALNCIVDPNSCPQGQTCEVNDTGNQCTENTQCTSNANCVASKWCNGTTCQELNCTTTDPDSCAQGLTCQTNDTGNQCVENTQCSADGDCVASKWCDEGESLCKQFNCTTADPESCPTGQACQENSTGNVCVTVDPCSECDAETEWCDAGTCTTKCTASSACGPNRICKIADGTCHVVDPGTLECYSDTDCTASGATCETNVCQVSGCNDSSGCAEGQICDPAAADGAGVCHDKTNELQCFADTDCDNAANETCVDNVCSPPEPAGCSTSGDCDADQICDPAAADGVGVCHDKTAVLQCYANGDCSDGKVCNTTTNQCFIKCAPDSPACADGTICDASNAEFPTCVPKTPQLQCYVDGDCSNGKACNTTTNQCFIKCAADSPACAEGTICDASDAEFPTCVAKTDTNQCFTDGDCSESPLNACLIGQTTRTCVQCVSTSHCSDNNVCSPSSHTCVQCVQHTDCGSGETCDVTTNACVPINTIDPVDACETTEECSTKNTNNKVCRNNKCAVCATSENCPSGLKCRPSGTACVACLATADCMAAGADKSCTNSGECSIVTALTICTSSSSCGGAFPFCVHNVCSSTRAPGVECTSELECPGTQVCQNSVCVDIPDRCTTDSQCVRPGERCNVLDGQCYMPTLDTGCTSDTDCASGQFCHLASRVCFNGAAHLSALLAVAVAVLMAVLA